ncbi:hypothetical protein EDE09_11153 [Neorhizobium sp. S3-V5DH]|nr:hypothetical protein EDE09_11153 [Neorhizobium sp. S3-V5DH]
MFSTDSEEIAVPFQRPTAKNIPLPSPHSGAVILIASSSREPGREPVSANGEHPALDGGRLRQGNAVRAPTAGTKWFRNLDPPQPYSPEKPKRSGRQKT